MSCYLRHLKDIMDEAGIEVTPGNKRQIDKTIHEIAGVDYKDCPATRRKLKQELLADERKRQDLVNFPVSESDLRTLSLSDIKNEQGLVLQRGRRVRQLHEGIKLWPYLLTLAIILVLLEGVILLWIETVNAVQLKALEK